MFLKSLTLRGFKTFADSTEIEFGPEARITAIVGPNGCGKSNLLDATRWVLGEDNTRKLRVAALPDIIFAGTNRRKPLSLAEVDLMFDNSEAKFNVPFTEVGIRRRAFRAGESEFFINKNLCRLKDIRDLLLDTGLGESTYSIITQGQVDAILSSKGEERRAVFEEAAGINKYKTRKLSAEKKLIAAEQNLLRVNDLKIEVSEHLLTLEEQARRAREYLALQAQIKEIEIGLSKKLVGTLLEKKSKLENELQTARQASAEQAATEKKAEETLAAFKTRLRGLELEIEEEQAKLEAEKDRWRDLKLDRRFLEGEIEREEKQLAELTRRLDEINQHKPDAASAAPLLSAAVEETKVLLNQLNLLIGFWGGRPVFSFTSEKDEARQLKLDLIAAEIKKTRFGLEAHRAQAANQPAPADPAEQSGRIVELKRGRDDLRRQIETLEESLIQKAERGTQAGSRTTEIEISLAKLEGELTGLSERLFNEYNLTLAEIEALPHTVANVSAARGDLAEKKSRLSSLEPVNLLAIEEFDKNKERLNFIEAQFTDLAAARENLKHLIAELDSRAEQNFLQTMSKLSVIFSETFARLFTGGEAKIQLADGVPALEAEIEISVRPHGRRWLPLSQLSGGERSLCAIAILFSLMKVRPSPFCFLDEVDAALDEANIGRFTEMLRDFAGATQMLVITHNKRTMAAADNIYGVTMEEPGISKVISMKLAEASV